MNMAELGSMNIAEYWVDFATRLAGDIEDSHRYRISNDLRFTFYPNSGAMPFVQVDEQPSREIYFGNGISYLTVMYPNNWYGA